MMQFKLLQSFSIVRGYGHIKLKNFKRFEDELKKRLEIFKKSTSKKKVLK